MWRIYYESKEKAGIELQTLMLEMCQRLTIMIKNTKNAK